MRGSTPSFWFTITAGLLTGFAFFQACLASGLPWGEFAYGGRHRGRLPVGYRSASAAAAAVYGVGAIVMLAEAGAPSTRRRLLASLTGYMVLGTGLNLASRSPSERLLWTPVCALTAVSAWRARRALG